MQISASLVLTEKECFPIYQGLVKTWTFIFQVLTQRVEKDETVNITLTLSISSTQQMQKVLRTLRNVPGVSNVYKSKKLIDLVVKKRDKEKGVNE